MGATEELAEWIALDDDLAELERLEARNSLAVYAGLHIPAEIESSELEGVRQLPMPARYIPAEHHRLILEKLEGVERGEIKRLMILAPPGSAKTSYVSVIFLAWYMGKHPGQSVLGASQTQPLADRFGRRARNLVASEVHRGVFGTGLAPDQRAAGDWETDDGAEYHATGVQPFAGRRADGVITDDLIRGSKDADSKTVRDSTWEWVIGDMRPRMKPHAWWVMINTRWHEDDPSGRILPEKWDGKSGWVTAKDGEKWYVLCLVAVIETQEEADNDPLFRDIGEIIWPEWFTVEMLAQEKKSQGKRNWNALYQQKPKPEEGSILLRQYWRKWPEKLPPECDYVISVYDTAFEVEQDNDYTARTTWGVFWFEEPPPEELEPPKKGVKRPKPFGGRYCCILLERLNQRMSFPDLRREALENYQKYKQDRILIEKKASGHSLIQELRSIKGKRIPVKPWTMYRDRDKVSRAHAAAPVLEDGCVWYMDRPWAEEVIAQCTAFPNAAHDDMVDTCVDAWLWLRKTYHLNFRGEGNDDEDDDQPQQRTGGTYGRR